MLRLLVSYKLIPGLLGLLQTTYEPLDAVLINSANKEDGHAGRDHVSVNDYMRGHWEMVLGQMLESPDVSEGGIQNCIQYALASSTSGFIISAVPKQTAHGKVCLLFSLLLSSLGTFQELFRAFITLDFISRNLYAVKETVMSNKTNYKVNPEETAVLAMPLMSIR